MSGMIFDKNDSTTRAFLAKIGEIVVLLNSLESHVEFYVWELISASGNAAEKQQVGRRITVPLEYKEKIDLLRSLIVERHGEEKGKEFLAVYKKLCKCGEIRNDIAHSQWFIQYGSNAGDLDTTKINMKKTYKRGELMNFSKAIENITLEDLSSYTDEINLTVGELIHHFFGK